MALPQKSKIHLCCYVATVCRNIIEVIRYCASCIRIPSQGRNKYCM